jgi:Flp pilus assembly protein TadD
MRHALLAVVFVHVWASSSAAENPEDRLARGIALLENGDLASALELLPPLLKSSDLDASERYQLEAALGYTYEVTGDSERAVLHLRAAGKLNPGIAGQLDGGQLDVALLLAQAHLSMQDAKSALVALHELPPAARKREAVMLLLSSAHSMANDDAAAERVLRELNTRGKSAAALRALALLDYERGLFMEAEKRFAQARQLEPHDYYTAVYHARSLLELDRLEAAVKQLAPLARRTPEVEYLRGLASLRAQDFPAATAAFRRALASNPQYSEALFGLGTALRRQKKHAEAREAYARFQKLERSWSAYRSQRDVLLEEAKASPTNAEAHGRVAAAALAQSDFETAEASFWRALTIAPRTVEYRIGLAESLQRTGRFQAAAVQYRRVIELEPENTTARRELKDLLRRHSNQIRSTNAPGR